MATTYTPNYHLGKQEDRSDKFLMQVITENMDIIDEQLKSADDKATAAAAGLKYKGAVNYYNDLPNDAEIGDAYTVLYAGSSGTVPDGTEYVWGELNNTAQWIDFSKDTYTKAEVDALLTAKQALLNANNKLDPAYINYDSTHAAVTESQRAQIGTNQTNIGKVQTQANWNTNNGVKNAAPVNSASKTNSGYFLNNKLGWAIKANEEYYIEFDFEKTAGDATVQLTNADGNIISTTIVACGSSSSGHAKRKVTPNVDAYGYNAYFNATGTITISNLMIYPAFIEDDTFEPYALPNTKITPELIDLVDSGAKNELELITPYGSGITNNPNLTITLNSNQTITVNGSVTTSGVIVISNTISGKLGKYLSGRPAGITADIRLTAYAQPSWSAVGNDFNGKGATITDNGNILITIYVIAGQTYSNLTFKPMICTKAAWDVSQNYVPYAPTNAELYEMIKALQA